MNLNNIDLNKLAVFCQVVDAGNYRLASEILNVTPSALSQAITGLEHALGFPVFQRVGRRLMPTPEGRALHREFRKAHGAFLSAMEGIAGSSREVSGLLKIGAYLEFARSRLTPVIGEFLELHPQAQVKLTFDTPSRLQRLLENGSLDLCFSIYPSRESGALASRPIYHQELVLVSPRDLLPHAPSYEQILAAPAVEYYFNHQPLRRWLHLHFRKKPRQLNVRAYASTAEMVLSLVAEGVGIGVVPLFLLQPKDAKRSVKVIRLGSRRFLDHIWLLERKAPATPLEEAFKSLAAQRLVQPAG